MGNQLFCRSNKQDIETKAFPWFDGFWNLPPLYMKAVMNKKLSFLSEKQLLTWTYGSAALASSHLWDGGRTAGGKQSRSWIQSSESSGLVQEKIRQKSRVDLLVVLQSGLTLLQNKIRTISAKEQTLCHLVWLLGKGRLVQVECCLH